MPSREADNTSPSPAGSGQPHLELVQALQDVDRVLKRNDRTQKSVERQLWNLVELVEAHFAREERGGYLAEAVVRAPQLSGTAEELLAEHTDLLEDASKLHILARSGVESEAWWRQIESDFMRLKGRLLSHEHAEHELLHKASHENRAR